MTHAARQATITITRSILIILWSYTAVNKLSVPAVFLRALRGSPVTIPYADTLVWLIPALEILIVALLLFPPLIKAGLLASMLLLVQFTCYIGYMLLTASKLPCSCGGIISKLNWPQHFILNIILTILATIAWMLAISERFLIPAAEVHPRPAGDAENLQQSRHKY